MIAARRLLDYPGVRRMLGLLNDDGEEGRIVGGAVRNALLGRPVTDFDITTTAVPNVVMSRAHTAGLRTIPIGLTHGTISIIVDGRPFEVTTLREDVETDGRHAKIRFGRDFAQDALRRDFTINALSMGIDGEVHDYAEGLADIAAGRVRFIGDPAIRIREDYLRILRFFRFSADYATGGLDADGLAACMREHTGLQRLSRERIRQELLKMVVAVHASRVIAEMSDANLLRPLLSIAPHPTRFQRLVAIDPNADPILRVAALAAAESEDAARLREALRLSNAETSRIEKSVRGLPRLRGEEAPAPAKLRERLFEDGREGALDSLLLAWAESRAAPDDSRWRAAAIFLRDTPEPRLPFSGADLIARGIANGRPLGDALKRLQAAWIKAGFPNDPRTLAALLDEVTGS